MQTTLLPQRLVATYSRPGAVTTYVYAHQGRLYRLTCPTVAVPAALAEHTAAFLLSVILAQHTTAVALKIGDIYQEAANWQHRQATPHSLETASRNPFLAFLRAEDGRPHTEMLTHFYLHELGGEAKVIGFIASQATAAGVDLGLDNDEEIEVFSQSVQEHFGV